MPIEHQLLEHRPVPLASCPFCYAQPFDPFMRGMIKNGWRDLWYKPAWCLICARCKQIAGYEAVNGKEVIQ